MTDPNLKMALSVRNETKMWTKFIQLAISHEVYDGFRAHNISVRQRTQNGQILPHPGVTFATVHEAGVTLDITIFSDVKDWELIGELPKSIRRIRIFRIDPRPHRWNRLIVVFWRRTIMGSSWSTTFEEKQDKDGGPLATGH